MPEDTHYKLAILLGSAILIGTAALQLLVGLTLLLGGKVGAWHFPIFALAIVAVLWAGTDRLARDVRPTVVMSATVATITLLIACFVLGAITFDIGNDSQVKHLKAIAHLVNGWNPVYDPHFERIGETVSANYFLSDLPASDHLVFLAAKGTYFQAAAAYSLFGNIEIGKGFNGVLMLAAALHA
jgi:hypothetical protein